MGGSRDDLNRVALDSEHLGEERDQVGVRPAAFGGSGNVGPDPPVLQSSEPLGRGPRADPHLQDDPVEGTRTRHAGNCRAEGVASPSSSSRWFDGTPSRASGPRSRPEAGVPSRTRRFAALLLLFLLALLRRPRPIQPDRHAAEELAGVPVDLVIAVQQVLEDRRVPGEPG